MSAGNAMKGKNCLVFIIGLLLSGISVVPKLAAEQDADLKQRIVSKMNPQWLSCEAETDCRVIIHSCSQFIGVNKTYRDAAMRVACSIGFCSWRQCDRRTDGIAVCRDRRCDVLEVPFPR